MQSNQPAVMTKPGVYAILNMTTHRVYVGSSTTKIRRRWQCHKASLKRHFSSSSQLQSDYDQYGPASLECLALENCDPCHCLEREQIWLDYYRRLGACVYNVQLSVASRMCWKHHPETIEKIRAASLGQRHTAETKAKLCAAWVRRKAKPGWEPPWVKDWPPILTPSGQVVTIRNLRQFCLANGLTPRSMYSVMSGERKSHKGYRQAPR